MRIFPATAFAILACCAQGLAGPRARADDAFAYSPKLSLRAANGILTNAGTLGGAAFSLAGVDAQLSYYVTPRLALGLGYQANFDFDLGIIPLSGPSLSTRWYFRGDGTRYKRDSREIASETHDKLAFYAGAEVAHRTFFRGGFEDNSSVAVTGDFFAVNGLLGLDYALSRRFEINLEGNVGGLSFAGSDERIRIKGYLFLTGFSFVW